MAKHTVLTKDETCTFFYHWRAMIKRSRQPFTIVIVKINQHLDKQDEVKTSEFLLSEIRQTDILFNTSDPFTWGMILTYSGANEAAALLNRLERHAYERKRAMTASIIEVRNETAEFEEVIQIGMKAVQEPGIHRVKAFEEQQPEQIKVSLIEENTLFRQALATSIKTMEVEGVELQLRLFEDGQSFLESNWYKSAHIHIVIMNDILPRRNGLDILHVIRRMPNQQKFIVFMMTSCKSEEEIIISYEKGADGFFIKPFNIRLFEARLQRTLRGIWR